MSLNHFSKTRRWMLGLISLPLLAGCGTNVKLSETKRYSSTTVSVASLAIIFPTERFSSIGPSSFGPGAGSYVTEVYMAFRERVQMRLPGAFAARGVESRFLETGAIAYPDMKAIKSGEFFLTFKTTRATLENRVPRFLYAVRMHKSDGDLVWVGNMSSGHGALDSKQEWPTDALIQGLISQLIADGIVFPK